MIIEIVNLGMYFLKCNVLYSWGQSWRIRKNERTIFFITYVLILGYYFLFQKCSLIFCQICIIFCLWYAAQSRILLNLGKRMLAKFWIAISGNIQSVNQILVIQPVPRNYFSVYVTNLFYQRYFNTTICIQSYIHNF